MLNGQVFYHGTIRKMIVAFGRLFSDIRIVRHDKQGNAIQTINIPIAYAPKEKWLVRIDSDPDLSTWVYTTLPRLSFEIVNYTYDASRKTNKLSTITCKDNLTSANPNMRSVMSPAPYNIDINMYILTKTQEDAMQIIEQILPTFNPEYTLSVNTIPEIELVTDVPIILNSISVEDTYDGKFEERRFVTHTLSFTLKTNLFGPVHGNGVILTSTANVTGNPNATYTATANEIGGNINENWDESI
jgi:hypothetical protein